MFTLYPAIDLKEGKAVRLVQGRMADATVYYPDPAEAARRWVEQGAPWLHVVDLDGAFAGAPRNLEAVRAIVRAAQGVPVQLGGGLRTLDAIEAALEIGVSRVIIGTKALQGLVQDRAPGDAGAGTPEPHPAAPAAGVPFLAQAVARFGPDRIVVGIDAKNGLVATDGWVHVSTVRATDLAVAARAVGVRTIIYTDISKDGMMAGPNFAEIAVMGQTGMEVIASGGIASLADIERLRTIPGVRGAIMGKALYTGAIDLKEALLQCR